MMPWWERYETVFQNEIDGLKDLGLEFTTDTSTGLLEIKTMLEIGGNWVRADIIYPHSYPYFQAMINVPGLNRPRHYEPVEGNLCLLGRSTRNWDPARTVADQMIREQLAAWDVLSAGIRKDEPWVGRDDSQAEPASAYYSYSAGAVLVAEGLRIDKAIRSGKLSLGLPLKLEKIIGILSLHAVVLGIKDQKKVHPCFTPSLQAFYGKLYPVELEIPWVRLTECPPLVDGNTATAFLKQHHPEQYAYISESALKGHVGLLGCLAPQEVRQGEYQEGWFFIGWSVNEVPS